MDANRRPWALVLAAVLIIENLWLSYPALRGMVLQVEETDVARGRAVAQDLGCFNCHGPNGRGGVANPGSEGGTVPSFHEGTPMMFVGNDNDIREYVLDGAPAAKKARESYREQMAAQVIHMPAYRGWVSEGDVDALVAYIRAASDLLLPADGQVARGAALAQQNGCFACHGDMGSGGLPNPGSLKGYIPGFIGEDFHDLVRDDEELRGWIRDGSVPRLRDQPLARYFLQRQRVQMPGFKEHLSEDDINALTAYVRWLASGEWRTKQLMAN